MADEWMEYGDVKGVPYPIEKSDVKKAFVAFGVKDIPDSIKPMLKQILNLCQQKYLKYRVLGVNKKGEAYYHNRLASNIKSFYQGEWEVYTVKAKDCTIATNPQVTRIIDGFVGAEDDLSKYLKFYIERTYDRWISWSPKLPSSKAVEYRALFGEDLYSLPKFMLIYTDKPYDTMDAIKEARAWESYYGISDHMIIAEALKIPVLNLHNDDSLERVRELI